jgi:hypothetical protein
MKIYAVSYDYKFINDRKKVKYFTSRKKCLTFIKQDIGHDPIIADISKGEELHWLRGEKLTAALKGKWEGKTITFCGHMGSPGYYSQLYTIDEIEVI